MVSGIYKHFFVRAYVKLPVGVDPVVCIILVNPCQLSFGTRKGRAGFDVFGFGPGDGDGPVAGQDYPQGQGALFCEQKIVGAVKLRADNDAGKSQVCKDLDREDVCRVAKRASPESYAFCFFKQETVKIVFGLSLGDEINLNSSIFTP